MSEDYAKNGIPEGNLRINAVLNDINQFLEQHHKTIRDYNIPEIVPNLNNHDFSSNLILEELTIPISPEDLNGIWKLNNDQKHIFDRILHCVEKNQPGFFFVDGPGGTGKTYLYRCLLTSVRSRGSIALATASSGIAALIMPGGRTAHSRFKIPISLDTNSTCNVKKQSELACLIGHASIIIWDEAPMAHRYALEALDRLLRDLANNNLLFGGKVVILGGDF